MIFPLETVPEGLEERGIFDVLLGAPTAILQGDTNWSIEGIPDYTNQLKLIGGLC